MTREFTGESYVETNPRFQRYFSPMTHSLLLRSVAGLTAVGLLALGSGPTVTQQVSGTTARLQAISPVSDQVAWASGTGGTYAFTTDGGEHWRAAQVPGADSLEFRDVQAFDSGTAWLLAAGPGERSRIYHTLDAGRSWTLQFTNTDSAAFFDCFAFWDRSHGIAVSDGVRGHFPILITDDGGAHWTLRPAAESPASDSGEGAFAASGTCIVTGEAGRAWIGTGASPVGGGRVLASTDYGRTWTPFPTPIQHGTSSTGITSLGFRGAVGVAAGGDINPRAPQTIRAARTSDGGHSWTATNSPGFPGGIYGISLVPELEKAMVAVGPGGAAVTLDAGASWTTLDSAAYWSVAFASAHAGWMVGPRGRIARIEFR